MEFSEERLGILKKLINDPLKQKDTIAVMSDTDAVTSMRLEKDGGITLRFDLGREILVEGLYNETGELHITQKGERASISLETQTMDNEELNELDFSQYGILDGENIVSLQEMGAKMIERFVNSNGGFAGFVMTTDNGQIIADNLFNIYTLSFINKNRTLEMDV